MATIDSGDKHPSDKQGERTSPLDHVEGRSASPVASDDEAIGGLALTRDEEARRKRSQEAAEQLLRLRKGATLGGLSWKELRDEGRR